MSEKLGVIEFFAMEAGEYLEQLDGLLARGLGAPGDEFPRLARALRGAALMANQQPIAEAAQAFEQLARTVHGGGRPFDAATRQLAVRAIDDLKILVRGARTWSEALQRTAADLTRSLEAAVGRTAPARGSGATRSPDAGTRAFVAREGAALATALDRAAKLLRQQPGIEALHPVFQALQPLRGVAGLGDLPPMAELLDGVERAVAEGGRPERAAAAAAVFDAAAHALTGATRAVATSGTADPETPEMRRFAEALGRLLEFDQPVVPIASLFFDDAGPHIVEQGTAPARRQHLGDVELVSHGEHLRQVADTLEQTESATRRTLRAHGLAGTFRALEQSVGPVGDAALAFTTAARNAIAAGFPAERAAELAAALRRAGQALSGAAGGNVGAVTAGLVAAAAALSGVSAVAPTVPRPAPTRPRAPSAQIPAPVPAPEADETDIAGSFTTYHRYLDALGLGAPSLNDLLSGPPADPRRAAAAGPAATVDEGVVPIATLVYDAPAAMTRARQLRAEAADALGRGEPAHALALLEEVLDLVKIGLDG